MNKKMSDKEKAVKNLWSQDHWDINTDDLWNNIQGDLNQEEEDRPIAFWWWTAGIVLILSVVGLWLYKSGTTPPSQVAAEVTITTPQVKQDQEVKEKDWATANIKTTSKTENNNVNKTAPQSDKTYTSSSHFTPASPLTNRPSTTPAQDLFTAGAEMETPQGSQLNSKTILAKAGKKTQVYSDKTIDKKVSKVNLPAESHRSHDEVEMIHVLAMGRLESHEHVKHPFHFTFPKRPSSLFFFASGGASLTHWDYSQAFNGKKHQWGKPGASMSVGTGKILTDRWYLKAALNYTSSIDFFRQAYNDVIEVNGGNPKNTVIDEWGGTTYSTESAKKTLIKSRDILWHNYYHQIHAEAALGYVFTQYDRWSISGEAGLGYNIHSWAHGYYPETKELNDIVKFNAGEESPYISSGLSSKLALQVDYNFSPVTLTSTIYYRNQHSAITRSGYPLEIKSSQIGLEFGIFYRPRWE